MFVVITVHMLCVPSFVPFKIFHSQVHDFYHFVTITTQAHCFVFFKPPMAFPEQQDFATFTEDYVLINYENPSFQKWYFNSKKEDLMGRK